MRRYILLLFVFFYGCSQQVGSARNGNEYDIEKVVFAVIKSSQNGKYELLSTDELKTIQEGDYLLVDVMPKSHYDVMHINGSVNIEVTDEKSLQTEKKIQEFRDILGSDVAKPIVFYCGYLICERSHIAAKRAVEMGYTNVYRYAGGLSAWKDASLPTVMSK
ncbi:MAG: rhodanese-like domain-containing protein [Desulfovibrionaceae bacterium]